MFSLKATKNNQESPPHLEVYYIPQYKSLWFIMLTFPATHAFHLKQRRMTSLGGQKKWSCPRFINVYKFRMTCTENGSCKNPFAFKYMAIFRGTKLKFQGNFPCKKYQCLLDSPKKCLPRDTSFLSSTWLLLSSVLCSVLSFCSLGASFWAADFRREAGAQRLWLLLQGWIKGRGTDAPWNEGKKTRQ